MTHTKCVCVNTHIHKAESHTFCLSARISCSALYCSAISILFSIAEVCVCVRARACGCMCVCARVRVCTCRAPGGGVCVCVRVFVCAPGGGGGQTRAQGSEHQPHHHLAVKCTLGALTPPKQYRHMLTTAVRSACARQRARARACIETGATLRWSGGIDSHAPSPRAPSTHAAVSPSLPFRISSRQSVVCACDETWLVHEESCIERPQVRYPHLHNSSFRRREVRIARIDADGGKTLTHCCRLSKRKAEGDLEWCVQYSKFRTQMS